MILVDANVLLRLVQPSHSMHAAAFESLARLRESGEPLVIVPQVLYEYWVVATRPTDVNGLGLSATEADADINKLIGRFRFLRDERSVFERWHELVAQYQVLGKNAHDARLVAAMVRHDTTRILTFNVSDFKRYEGIEVLDPLVVATPTGG
ncbi:type II toxin-antitoxin system VapC family toxin [Botrimarina mediterranea]|uniref:type II toxin-antitoxin system VapC family toxin n=1 Tax=Botrimarina mediterranea TaxID=2528022 RepID=UPI001189A466|nr:tRNA(fMet)-specific endonuclease VapC [Planctomycetes bacterium K2D]